MQIRLYTLSPLHIGTGETLSPLDYVLEGDTFYRITQEELYQLVRTQIPGGTKALRNWVRDEFADLRELRDNREQSRRMQGINAQAFFRAQGQSAVLQRYLADRGGQAIRLDDDNRNRKGELRLGEVRTAIRTAGQAYLPGTSLKGALRTALLYDYLQRHGDYAKLEHLIRKELAGRRPRKETFAQNLEAEAFFCVQTERGRSRKREAQMDLLKYVAFSDAYPAADAPLEVGKINLYLIEKEQTRDRNATPRLLASRQGQSSYAEMLPAGTELRAEMQVDGTTLSRLLKWEEQGRLAWQKRRDEFHYYQDLRQKLQRLFDLSDELLAQPNAESLEHAIGQHCQAALTRFSQAQLQRQREWQEDYAAQHDPRGDRFADRIEQGYAPVYAYGGQLMHLGYAAGFSATTVLLHFLQDRKHRDLYERVMAQFELGRAPRQKGRYQPKISRFPKSRRLVETASQILPLGWLALLGAAEEAPTVEAAVATTEMNPATPAAPVVVEPQYYEGKLNYKKPPLLDAVVTQSGRPNQVKVYLRPDNSPEMKLNGYRNPLEEGEIIQVLPQVNKKGELLSVAYRGRK